MRVCLLRSVSALLFASAVLLPSRIYAQSGNAPSAAGGGTPASDNTSGQPKPPVGGPVAPVLIHVVEPQYTEEARNQRVTGTVLVNLIVDTHGLPQNVHVLHGIGMGLDMRAVEAVMQYRFNPATEGGKPVAVELNVEVKFGFAGKAQIATDEAKDAATNKLGANSQTPDPSAKYVVPGCAIDHTKATDADKALQARKYPDAERLYGEALTADPASSPAMAGLVRTTLAEGKLPDALAMATKYSTARPNDPVLLDALGEVRFRRGEIGEAAHALNQSSRINPCNGRTHYDAARFLNLSSMHASAQHELEIAHAQAPEDADIARTWRATHAVPPTAEQRLATLKQRLDNPALTDAQKEATQAAIKSIETAEKGSCELVTPLTEVKLPIVPISTGADTTLASMYESALEVQINGKKKRLEIDTGASGLLLTSAVAKSAGLVPELQVKGSGIGDDGAVNMFVTHVDDIKIGKMEFKNCRVGVLAPDNAMERMPDMDGLIGPDVFRNYVITLDVPEMEMRLGPLPTRPGDEARTTSLATTGGDETPVSVSDSAKDRYVAPEMKDWTPVFRSAHMLIFPTVVGSAPVKLFLMDTGASRNMISPAAAREVTQISDFTNHSMQGISGKVQKMLIADKVAMTFAGVRQMNYGMDAFDSSLMSRSTGVDISGIIGFPALRELVISIDYRDSLVHVVYDPRKGYHAHNE